MDGDGDCIECPDNADCFKFDTLGSIGVDEGYWRIINNTDDIRPCPMGEKACKGGPDSDCRAGYQGVLCAVW